VGRAKIKSPSNRCIPAGFNWMVGFVPKSLPPQKTTLSLGMEWCFSINQVLADSFSLKDHLTGFYLIMNVLKEQSSEIFIPFFDIRPRPK
jgi:hypothetical protein